MVSRADSVAAAAAVTAAARAFSTRSSQAPRNCGGTLEPTPGSDAAPGGRPDAPAARHAAASAVWNAASSSVTAVRYRANSSGVSVGLPGRGRSQRAVSIAVSSAAVAGTRASLIVGKAIALAGSVS
jgi:hypothetical protein